MIRRRDDREDGAPPGEGGSPRGSFREVSAPRSPGARFRSGWSLPLEVGPEGRLLDERLDPVVSTARLILEIVPGERRLLPDFGCRIHCLRSLSTQGERQLGAALVEEALDRWAPSLGIDRAEILSVKEGTVRMTLRARGEWHELSLAHRTASSREALQPEAPWMRRAQNGGREARDP